MDKRWIRGWEVKMTTMRMMSCVTCGLTIGAESTPRIGCVMPLMLPWPVNAPVLFVIVIPSPAVSTSFLWKGA